MQWIEACEALAHAPGEEHWTALCAPSTACLEALCGVRPEQCNTGPYLLDYLGIGPNALAQRLIIYLMWAHVDERSCTPQDCSIPLLRDIWGKALTLRQLGVSIKNFTDMLCHECPSCNHPVCSNAQTENVRYLLLGLLGFTELSDSDHARRTF